MPDAVIEQSVAAYFEKQVNLSPNTTAITFGQQTKSYAELNSSANSLAHSILAHLGARSEPIPFIISNRLQAIVTIMAIVKAGKFFVPLDPSMPRQFLNNILADCSARLIVVDEEAAPVVHSSLTDQFHSAPTVVMIEDTVAEKDTNPNLSIDVDSPVQMIYTSGSSGEPKGVLHSHRNIMYSTREQTNAFGYAPEDRFALLLSLSYAMTNADVLTGLLNGATLCLYDVNQAGLSNLADWLDRQRVTTMRTVPTMFRNFANMVPDNQPLRYIRLITLGGEPVFGSDIDLMQACIQPPVYLGVRYGSTEMLFSAWHLHTEDTHFQNDIAPLGLPVPGISFYLIDENGQEVSKGEVGEIVVRSRYLAQGYWRKQELTASSFRPASDGSGERLFNTGDLGRLLPNGELIHMGRIGSFVKVRGFRIEPVFIESALRQHTAIQNTHIKIFEPKKGSPIIVAYILPKQNFSLTISEMREYLKELLPDHMIPARFIMLDEFPLTHSGKIDSLSLPDPDSQRPSLAQEYVPPRTTLEQQLAAIWSDELGIDDIGVHDNFFELGGHSLLALQLFTQIEDNYSVSLPLATLFQSGTIEALAKVIEEGAEQTLISLVPIQPLGDKPPFFCIHGIGGHVLIFHDLANYLDLEQPFYALRSRGAENGREVPGSIEEMAAQYIQEIQTVQPTGPYFIGGYSFGGFVVYEMARQLLAQGQDVGLLAIFDTRASRLKRFREALSGLQYLQYNLRVFGKTYKKHNRALADVPLSTKRDYLVDLAGRMRQRKNSPDQDDDMIPVELAAELPTHLQDMIKAHRLAIEKYLPRPYRGRLTLFRAMCPGQGRHYGWHELAQGGVEEYDVPGDHNSIIQEPNVPILAAELTACINRILKTTAATETARQ